MAKKIQAYIKLQVKAQEANPSPPVGPALGQHGVNIMDFVKAYNDATSGQAGTIIPVEISIYEDRSFTFVTKTPPAAATTPPPPVATRSSGLPKSRMVPALAATDR